MTGLLNGLIGLLTLIYPATVYFGTQYTEPRWIAASLCFLLLLRLAQGKHPMRPLLLAAIAYAVFAAWSNQLLTLYYYPVVINAAMLLLFTASLFYPPSIIERLARVQQPNLSPQGVLYTQRVTQIWCVFFLMNGAIAWLTVLWGNAEIWSLYNGLIAYLLMGALFGGEYLFRRKTRMSV